MVNKIPVFTKHTKERKKSQDAYNTEQYNKTSELFRLRLGHSDNFLNNINFISTIMNDKSSTILETYINTRRPWIEAQTIKDRLR